jgi:FAD/FMN-containing dehydrogenase
MSDDLYAKLATHLGPKGFAADEATLAPYLIEWRGRHGGQTPFLAMPASTQEVADTVRLCAEARVAITTQGGNTGLVGGQIPQGEVLLSLKRMNRIRAIDVDNDSLTVEAGVVLASVQAAAAESNRLFPLSLASEGSATIGGLISTNAGGVHVLRYGMMRDLVLGIEAVLPNGQVLESLKGLRKDNTGYDLKQLFIGAEGTLGVVTAASLKLHPRPRARETVLLAVATATNALALLHRLKGGTGAVSAFEVMNRLCVDMTIKNVAHVRHPLPGAALLVLVEFEAAHAEGLRASVETTLADALAAGEVDEAIIAENAQQTRDFWALRESASAGHKPEGPQVNHDISVPVSQTPAFLAAVGKAIETRWPGTRLVVFGHMGDGNFHYTALAPQGIEASAFAGEAISQTVFETAVALGGSISAEHGIGVARKRDLERFKDEPSLALMRAIKNALDPHRIMNPRALI